MARLITQLKKIMYTTEDGNLANDINYTLFYYDFERAKNKQEKDNARKEWDYRFNRLFLVGLL